MRQAVEQFFEEQCDCFARNDLARLAQRFASPTAIYFGDRIMLFKNPRTIQSALTIKRNALLQLNYKRTGFRVIAQSITAKEHLSAWIEFRHFDACGGLITTSTSRYFCACRAGTNLLVQLVEYLQIPDLGYSQETRSTGFAAHHQSTFAPA